MNDSCLLISMNMADKLSPEKRSWNMSRIRGEDTRPEEYIRKRLYEQGYRYRKNYKRIIGNPDIWLSKYNTALFVNGCFWHRHEGCQYAYTPKSRVEFWTLKFEKNTERDRVVREKLKKKDIRVLVIWECTIKRMIKSKEFEGNIILRLNDFLHSETGYLEL